MALLAFYPNRQNNTDLSQNLSDNREGRHISQHTVGTGITMYQSQAKML